jgi:hypothetical protein
MARLGSSVGGAMITGQDPKEISPRLFSEYVNVNMLMIGVIIKKDLNNVLRIDIYVSLARFDSSDSVLAFMSSSSERSVISPASAWQQVV